MSDSVLKEGQQRHKVIAFATTLVPVQRTERPTHKVDIEQAREEARLRGHAEGVVIGSRKGESAGYIAGIKRGRLEGEKTAHAEVLAAEMKLIEDLRAELATIADLNQAALESWAKAAEAALLNRVVAITRHILHQELSLSRESLIPIVASAVREVANARTARVRVNPFDRHLLAERKDEIMSLTANLQHLEIVDDPSITGGAIVETDGGRVDATVEGKLISLEAELTRSEVPALNLAPEVPTADEEVA